MLPLVIGHRGVMEFGYENNIHAVDVAKNMHIHGIEVDARLTKDNKIILYHDEKISISKDEKTYVKDCNYNLCKKYDIPLLKEMIKSCYQNQIVLNVEIKSDYTDIKTPRLVCNQIKTCGKSENLFVSSYNVKALEIARYVIPDFDRMYIVDKIPNDWLHIMKKYKCKGIVVSIHHNTLEEIIELSMYKYCIYVFTVNDRNTFNILTSLNIGVITDYPYTLQKYK